ncbi:hypothetical protein HPB51_004988 [Rhipicephalus microplus]|uniref:Uncharacterized protein n=1 Tax=Rhipicephalus microplus TaxID=6941 RepID=A0A9J6EXR8_RHIMP|nr:hypothetical protein HPB51_004988 [Rhipicephalus microplus]
MYHTEAKKPSPGSNQEHLVTIDSAGHLRMPTATESDGRNSSFHLEARVLDTLPVGYAKSEANISANALSAMPEESGSRGWTEGRRSAGDLRTRQSVSKDRAYQARQWHQEFTVEGRGNFEQLRKVAKDDGNTKPSQQGTLPQGMYRPDTKKKAIWEVPEGPSMKAHPTDVTPFAKKLREIPSFGWFDLLRVLNHIADEFAKFLDRREQRGDQDRIYTIIGSEDELIDADKAITGIIDSQGSSATATEADGIRVERDVKNISGSTDSGDKGATVLATRDEADTSKRPAEEGRPRISSAKAGSPLYCSFGPMYLGPLPRALCSYFIVYDSVYYDSNRKLFRVAFRGVGAVPSRSRRSCALTSRSPRTYLSQTRVLVSEFPVAMVFASKARALIQEGSLSGLAFDLSLATDYDARSRATLPQGNAMWLADSLRLVYPDCHHVCLSVSLAVHKFNVSNLDDANCSLTPGVGSLATHVNTEVSYSELCEELGDPHRHFDEATLSTYVHIGKAWLGFDDDTSIEIKIDKLSRKHRLGCLLADSVDLDDFRNVCQKGDFPRLRLLKRAVFSGEHR